MKNRLGTLLWIMVLGTGMLAGCANNWGQWQYPVKKDQPVASQVPVPTAYPISTQQKMQAMHHWSVLAEDVAGRISQAIDGNPMHDELRIYVVPAGTTPFEKAFRELLITQIVQRGIRVTDMASNQAHLNTDIQMVRHHQKSIYTEEGVYRALRPGLYVRDMPPLVGKHTQAVKHHVRDSEIFVDAGVYTREYPRNELMITSSLTYNNDYLVRTSSIYYVDDPEWWQYMHKLSPKEPRMPVVNYKLIAR